MLDDSVAGPPVDGAGASPAGGSEPGSGPLPRDLPEELASYFDPLYQELKHLARAQLRGRGSGATLCTTVLVHELYLRMLQQKASIPIERGHFMALSARAMRQIIVDHARLRGAKKRGQARPAQRLHDELYRQEIDVEAEATFLLALDQALQDLLAEDPRLAQVAELRFFGGLSVRETAEVIEVSEPTVKRDSRLARAYLLRALGGTLGSGPAADR